MKTLPILLVLLSSIAWGQEFVGEHRGIVDKQGHLVKYDSLFKTPARPKYGERINERIDFIYTKSVADSLVKWWDEYEKVSDGDSVRHIYESPYWKWDEQRKIYLPVQRDTMWTHPYPDFPGFIEFLRRKK